MITVPESFAASTIEREGEAGRQWLADLPKLVERLSQAWHLVLDGQPMHGYFGLVVPVIQLDKPCALKISWINEVTKDEAASLAVWNGNGIVQLFDGQPAKPMKQILSILRNL